MINENTIIIDYFFRQWVVVKVYKTGVLIEREWKNWAGWFHKRKFLTYDELFNNNNYKIY